MELQEKNTSELLQGERLDFQEFLEFVRDSMREMHREVSLGAELHRLDLSNELTDTMKEVFDSPIKTSFEALASLEESIIQMIQEQFVTFLETKIELIDCAYLVAENSLHYSIVLKDQSIESEASLLEFKMAYDETPVSVRFPLIINFPEYSHLEGAELARQLDFGKI